MKKQIASLVVGLLVGCFFLSSGFAQENVKLAQSGLKFLSVVSDARAAAMGEAMTSLQIGSSALFFNPAGMSEMGGFVDVTASTNQWIADIKHFAFSLAISPAAGDYGVFGLSIQSVNYGDFYGTQVNPAAPLGYDETGIFQPTALAVGVGYARKLTDRFSIGGQVRWAHQKLGWTVVPEYVATTDTLRTADTNRVATDNNMTPLVFDFGVQFKTNIKSLVIGMAVRNFSREVKYAEEGFQAPLVFNLGISMNLLDLVEELPEEQALFLSFDASHHRDHPEEMKVGLDYRFLNMVSLRGGYISSNDESNFSWGVGVSKFGATVDYAYTPFGVFGKVQRLTARFTM
jgi:hypothetical protein